MPQSGGMEINMAKYELPIYGEDDEIIKTYKTNVCPWGIYIKAADMQEKLQNADVREQLQSIGDMLKTVFKGLTDDELSKADSNDVVNTFKQIVSGGNTIVNNASVNTSKN